MPKKIETYPGVNYTPSTATGLGRPSLSTFGTYLLTYIQALAPGSHPVLETIRSLPPNRREILLQGHYLIFLTASPLPSSFFTTPLATSNLIPKNRRRRRRQRFSQRR